eukprot:2821336-Amphidinium_carterae.1
MCIRDSCTTDWRRVRACRSISSGPHYVMELRIANSRRPGRKSPISKAALAPPSVSVERLH